MDMTPDRFCDGCKHHDHVDGEDEDNPSRDGSPSRNSELLSTSHRLSFNAFQLKESCKYFPLCYSYFKYYFISFSVMHSSNAVLLHFNGKLAEGLRFGSEIQRFYDRL